MASAVVEPLSGFTTIVICVVIVPSSLGHDLDVGSYVFARAIRAHFLPVTPLKGSGLAASTLGFLHARETRLAFGPMAMRTRVALGANAVLVDLGTTLVALGLEFSSTFACPPVVRGFKVVVPIAVVAVL